MRRSLRFLSSCSSSSLIARIPVQPKEVTLHAVQNHPFQAVQVVEAKAEGFPHGGQEWLSGIFAHQAEQLTQGQHHQLAAMLFQSGEVISDLRCGLEDGLFFWVRIAALEPLAARGAMGQKRDALMLLVGDALVSDEVACIELHLDLVLGLPDLYLAADPRYRNRVAVAVQGYIAFDIHGPLMQTINFRDPDGQRFQMPLLEGKQLARNGTDMLFISGVDAIAPLPGLFIQVWPAGERTASQEVVLDEPEWPFDASRAVGIATLVGYESEIKAFGKGSHLGHGNHLPSRSSQHHHVGVVDHDALRAASEIPQRFGEKDFAIEALKRCVALKEQHARVAQHGRSSLHFAFLPGEFEFMGRSIV